jgi:hypothetical protein
LFFRLGNFTRTIPLDGEITFLALNGVLVSRKAIPLLSLFSFKNMQRSLARKTPSFKACFGHEIGLSEFCERGEGLARSLLGGDTDGAIQVVSTTACERGFLLGESRFSFYMLSSLTSSRINCRFDFSSASFI